MFDNPKIVVPLALLLSLPILFICVFGDSAAENSRRALENVPSLKIEAE